MCTRIRLLPGRVTAAARACTHRWRQRAIRRPSLDRVSCSLEPLMILAAMRLHHLVLRPRHLDIPRSGPCISTSGLIFQDLASFAWLQPIRLRIDDVHVAPKSALCIYSRPGESKFGRTSKNRHEPAAKFSANILVSTHSTGVAPQLGSSASETESASSQCDVSTM